MSIGINWAIRHHEFSRLLLLELQIEDSKMDGSSFVLPFTRHRLAFWALEEKVIKADYFLPPHLIRYNQARQGNLYGWIGKTLINVLAIEAEAILTLALVIRFVSIVLCLLSIDYSKDFLLLFIDVLTSFLLLLSKLVFL